jgi:hypothetical protein
MTHVAGASFESFAQVCESLGASALDFGQTVNVRLYAFDILLAEDAPCTPGIRRATFLIIPLTL